MKVALLIRTLLSGGAEKQCVILAEVLKPAHDVIVVVQNGEEINESFRLRLDKISVPIYSLKQGGLIRRTAELSKLLKRQQVDIVFSYLTSDNILAAGAKVLNSRLKVVGGIRNCKMDHRRFLVNKLLSRYVHNRTVFNNYSGYQGFIKKGYKAHKCHVISNCIDEINNVSLERNRDSVVNIISVCRFIEQKDLPTALRVMRQLVDEATVKVKYYLVGYGALEQHLRELIVEMDLSDYVEIVIKPDNLQDYFEMADIYFSTSLFEGTSNSIMEALSFDLPVVTTNVGDNNQLVEQYKNGMVLEVGDEEGMVDKLKLLCSDSQLRITYGKQSKKILVEKFSRSKFEENYQTLINELNGRVR